MYPKMPVMSIENGRSTAYPNYLVLKSTAQSFVDGNIFFEPGAEKCLN